MADTPDSSSAHLDDLAQLEKELKGGEASEGEKPSNSKEKAGGKKKKGSKTKGAKAEVLWTVRVEKMWLIVRAYLSEIFRGLRSPDPQTRRMSFLFVMSLVGLIAVFGLGIHRLRTLSLTYQKGAMTDSEKDAKHIGDMFKKTAEENKHKYSLLTVGMFTVQLKPIPNQKQVPGVLNMAEIEIVVECDSKETRNYMEDNLPQARNQITNVFTPLERDELMTREGKRKLKKILLEKLNIWLPKGKVDDLFFSKLVLS